MFTQIITIIALLFSYYNSMDVFATGEELRRSIGMNNVNTQSSIPAGDTLYPCISCKIQESYISNTHIPHIF